MDQEKIEQAEDKPRRQRFDDVIGEEKPSHRGPLRRCGNFIVFVEGILAVFREWLSSDCREAPEEIAGILFP